jgi:hypothetical protein
LLSERQKHLAILALALPNNEHAPTKGLQGLGVANITLAIVIELFAPKLDARLGKSRQFAVGVAVPVPKAAMHKYDYSSRRENDIWPTWKTLDV